MLKIATIIMCLTLALEPGIWSMVIEKIKKDPTTQKIKKMQKIIIVLSVIGTIASIIIMNSIYKEAFYGMKLILFSIFVSQLSCVFLSLVVLHTKEIK